MTVQPSPEKISYKAMETEELVLLAQQQDKRAMQVLIERYQRLVYVSLMQLMPERQDVSDLAQEVLLRVCRSINSLRNPKTFKYWLNRIVTNLFYDELRKRPRRLPTMSLDHAYESLGDDTSSPMEVPDTRQLPETLALQSELDQRIHEAIQTLPEPFRTAIVLRELQGLSYDEIASLTQCTLGTVKSRIARARLRLQSCLAPYLEAQDALSVSTTIDG